MDSTSFLHAIVLVVAFAAWIVFWIAALISIFRKPASQV